ncbi:MAG: TRAP transporter small permease [Rubrobacter sp.]|nr:TRAP transporter small permease [Rubrobacter sp.]
MEDSKTQEAASREALTHEQAAELERREEEALPSFFRVLDIGFKALIALLLCVLVFTVGANVIGRFVFNYSLAWADELSRFIFIWLIFIGAAVAYFRGQHISVDYLVQMMPRRLARATNLLADLLVLFILGVILWGSWQVLTTFPGRSALLGVPMNLVNASVPLAAGLMTLMCLYRIANDIRLLREEE